MIERYSITCLLVQVITHSHPDLLTHSITLTRLPNYSITHLLDYPTTQLLSIPYLLNYSMTQLLSDSMFYSLNYLRTQSLTHSITYILTRTCIDDFYQEEKRKKKKQRPKCTRRYALSWLIVIDVLLPRFSFIHTSEHTNRTYIQRSKRILTLST